MTQDRATRRRAAIISAVAVLAAAVMIAIGIQAVQVLSYEAANAACDRSMPFEGGSYWLAWRPLPYPHWDCSFEVDGSTTTVDLGFWP